MKAIEKYLKSKIFTKIKYITNLKIIIEHMNYIRNGKISNLIDLLVH